MATEYDKRRPRLPAGLARAIDAKRGQVPFNRWVVETLEKALGGQGSGDTRESIGSGFAKETRATETPAPSRASEPEMEPQGDAPRSLAYVCPVASCKWPGSTDPQAICEQHRRPARER